MTDFAPFLRAFPPRPGETSAVDGDALAAGVESALGVDVPKGLRDFWSAAGSGYFGQREIFVFGDRSVVGRDPLIEWNQKEFWRGINIPPSRGGAVFFAETCFGEQLAYRWEGSDCKALLFLPDTFETFLLTQEFDELFSTVLTERDALLDPELFEELSRRLGLVEPGMHYAPIVSPLIGGSAHPDNFHLETAKVHITTSAATRKAVEGLPAGAPVDGIDVEFEK